MFNNKSINGLLASNETVSIKNGPLWFK